ncbi:MAG: Glu-tRNA(Gln) amidotransferase subunit GatE [Deltaproteobacteria bacterium]|nr:Glu-tRNA(Gln) amidotransferase subunit GatE [Deltaproteobacteria bacterium]
MDAWRKSLLEGLRFDDLGYYQSLGFKSGLEIHHQLDTRTKLFCHCPVRYRNDAPDAVILRHMRPTLSEMGTYDGTALMEFKTRKQVVYHLYRDNVCTYEMDDTPPFPINQEALDFAIEIALMLNCKLVDEVHITRKQYLDGSIPTGFQRTAIVGVDGWVPYRDRKIRIQQLAIEEDACREVSDVGHQVVFRTDRLSTPLIEIVTKPDMRTPHEVAEVDELLGRLLRSSGRVRRGLGSARQDVNVSITGSDRVETKGVPRTPDIRALTHYEALRHKALIELRDELKKRGITTETFRTKEREVTGILSSSRNPRIAEIRKLGWPLVAIALKGWGPLLRHKTQPGMTFAHELAGRVRVIACVDEMPNLFVLDGLGEGFSVEDETRVRKAIGATDDDAVVLAWGPGEDARTSVNEIIARAKEATIGVPAETRQHLPDACRTDFERILPGPDRMYPDTDSPPVPIARDRIARITAQRALRPWEREELYVARGVPVGLARQLAIHRHARMFERLIADKTADALLLAVAICEWQTAIRRERALAGKPRCWPDEAQLEQLLKEGLAKKTPRPALLLALKKLYAEGIVEVPEPLAHREVGEIWARVQEASKDVKYKTASLTADYLTGRIMKESGWRASPADARGIVGKHLSI